MQRAAVAAATANRFVLAAALIALSMLGTDWTPDNGYFRGRRRRQCYGEDLP
jgi:hypothetical protein